MAGKHKVTGDIDDQNLVTKVDTWVPSPVLGDMLVETTYSDYRDFNGVKFPTHIVQKQGRHFTLDLNVTNVRTNVENASLQVPDAVRQATAPPVRVVSQKIADGVWFLGGGSHNSVLVEFKDYGAVVEAPNDENRSNAVIAEVKKLAPNKPIQYLINTHRGGGSDNYYQRRQQGILRTGLEAAPHARSRQAFAESAEDHLHHVQGQVCADGRKPYARNTPHSG
jgi:hypothetical protein